MGLSPNGNVPGGTVGGSVGLASCCCGVVSAQIMGANQQDSWLVGVTLDVVGIDLCNLQFPAGVYPDHFRGLGLMSQAFFDHLLVALCFVVVA